MRWVGKVILGGTVALAGVGAVKMFQGKAPDVTPTGLAIARDGVQTNVGSFPCNSVLTDDGKFMIVTNVGYREQLSVIEVATGKLVDKAEFNGGGRGDKDTLYYGLAIDGRTLYASCGEQGKVAKFTLSDEGKLKAAGEIVLSGRKLLAALAGVATVDGKLYVAENGFDPGHNNVGHVHEVDPANGKILRTFDVGGYPIQLVAKGPRVFCTSERDGVVSAISLPAGNVSTVKVGAHPVGMRLGGDKLYVANSGGDSISVVNPTSLLVEKTFLVRPAEVRGLPACSPLEIAIDEESGLLFASLADMNAIGVLDLKTGDVKGYVPAGWYPTTVQSVRGRLIFANAKGIEGSHPNAVNSGPGGSWGKYGPNIIEGTVASLDLDSVRGGLANLTKVAIMNSRFDHAKADASFTRPPIKHVVYIIKENRTYDQVFGDMDKGERDASLCLFPREVTPNQHALAERFVLMDQFYVCAEVSADGWNWSTSGAANPFAERTFFHGYSGRRTGYDAEGANQGVAVDLKGLPDVSTAPGGYIWDDCLRHGVSIRNYGFFVGEVEALGTTDKGATKVNGALKKALATTTDQSFRNYDLRYADSDLWVKLGLDVKSQLKSYGEFKATSRFAEWKREFDGYVKAGKAPGFTMIRFPRDHTAGTATGQYSARAMVADNDFAVGQVVEAISHSPFWKDTVICVLEDDAQAGFDHVDSHRSNALVISPWVKKEQVYSRFANTDSMLRTMETLLGIPPMCAYDAAAPLIDVFGKSAENAEPYEAIVPKKEIAGEINSRTAYRSRDSERLVGRYAEESAADIELNDILWGSIKGAKAPRPAVRNRVRMVDRD